MGLFDLFRKKEPPTLVRITFRDITEPPPRRHGGGYIYVWSLGGDPEVGQHVVVPGMDGLSWAVVIGVNDATQQETSNFELKSVIRKATPEEVAKGQARHDHELNAWLDMMRRAANLATTGRIRHKVPDGFPEVPPAEGTAPPHVAERHGAVWWRAYKNAREDDESKKFKSLGHRWYAIRDRGH